jgi:adenylate cyclase
VPAGDLKYEVDEFHGENEGLTVAEIELPDENYPFQRAEWLGEEVTGDVRYYNSMLMKTPYTKW